MGCAGSKNQSSALGDSEDCPEGTKTCCCWTGIRKSFSKSKKSKSVTSSEVKEDDVDREDDSDDVTVVDDISEASIVSSQSVNDAEPRELHKSCSDPDVLGLDCHQVLIPPSLREVEDRPLSPSYPKNVDVSSQAVQLYQHGDNVYNVDQEIEGEVDDDIEQITETSSETTQAVVVSRCNLVFRANIMITYQTDEVSIRRPNSQPGNAITRLRRGNARAQFRFALSVDEIAAMYFISQLWAFIRNPFRGAYRAGLQTVYDALMGTPDDTDVEEDSAVVVHEGAGDHPPEERHPDLSSWSFIFNVCGIVYQTGLQIVQDLFTGEDVNEEKEEEGRGDVGEEEGEKRKEESRGDVGEEEGEKKKEEQMEEQK